MKFHAFPALFAALVVSIPESLASFRAPERAPREITLPHAAPKQAAPSISASGRLHVGEVRALPKAASLARWHAVDGGYVTRVRAESPGARGLRVRIELGTVPGAFEVRAQGSGAARIESMEVDPAIGGEAWTPWTEGEAQLVEVFSRVQPATDAVRIGAVVHFDASPVAKAASTCTLSTSCTTGEPALDAAIAERKTSMARIQFVSGGGAFLCSATLIDTPRNPAAYVLTANHCVETAAEAASVTSLWFYEAGECNAAAASPAMVQVAGGMQMVFTNFNVDASLLLMNRSPPPGASFAPLSPGLVANNTPLVSLSHPRGDTSRWAEGTMARVARDAERPYDMYFVRFSRGMIEGGSSGSGAYTRANGRLELAGILSQGPLEGSCANPNKFGLYGRLEAFHPQIAQYIGAAPAFPDDAPNRVADATLAITSAPIDTLAEPVVLPRRIDYPGDVDIFRFTLSAPAAVTAYTQGGQDLVSTILDANGRALEANDDAQVGSTDTGITRELGPGTYYLHVAHWVPSATGEYQVVLRSDRVDRNYTALWWNPEESGWGINLNHQGNILFATLFTYQDDGAPMWLVMSRGERQPDGSYFGALHRTSGPPFNASPWRPVDAVEVGTMHLAFSGADNATLTYIVNGRRVDKPITRQVFKALPDCRWSHFDRSYTFNVQDLWWNPGESGWGMNLAHQGDTLFATLFTYAANGQGLWLVMPNGQADATGTITGALYRTRGPAFDTTPWTGITSTQVGTLSLSFNHGNSAQLSYTVDGVPVSKTITRQVFSTPRTACES